MLQSYSLNPLFVDQWTKRDDSVYISYKGLVLHKYMFWTILCDSLPVAVAYTSGTHPATIYENEWYDPESFEEKGISFSPISFGTEWNPISIYDIGIDYFLRVSQHRVIWFIDVNGDIQHSGAKIAGLKRKTGRRYCHICDKLVSANNFVSQHMRLKHKMPKKCQSTFDVQNILLNEQ
jgi:hypothetical protein